MNNELDGKIVSVTRFRSSESKVNQSYDSVKLMFHLELPRDIELYEYYSTQLGKGNFKMDNGWAVGRVVCAYTQQEFGLATDGKFFRVRSWPIQEDIYIETARRIEECKQKLLEYYNGNKD